MPNTPRLGWPYPAENQDPWYEPFQDLVSAMDATAFANTEDRNIFLMSTATFTWDSGTGTLTWDAAIELSSPISGFRHTVAAGNQVIADGAMFYVELTRNPTTNLTVAGAASSSQPPSVDYESFYAICIRRGAILYFRNGGFLDSAVPRSIFGAGGSTNFVTWPVGTAWADVYTAIQALTVPVVVLVEYDVGGDRVMTHTGVPVELWNVRFDALVPSGVDIQAPRTVNISVADEFLLGVDPDSGFAVLLSRNINWSFDTSTDPIAQAVPVFVSLDGGRLEHNAAYCFITDSFYAEIRNSARLIGTGGTALVQMTDSLGAVLARTGARLGNTAFDGDGPQTLDVTLDSSVEVDEGTFNNVTVSYTRQDRAAGMSYEDADNVSLGAAETVQAAIDYLKFWYRTSFNVEDVTSSAAQAALGNGTRYWPLVEGAADTLKFQVRVGLGGPYALRFSYYMATSHAGNVSLRVDKRKFGAGNDPTTALTAGVGFTVTPGSNTTLHMVTEANSTSCFTGELAEGDLVTFLVTRVNDGSDTHTGDMRVLGITLVPHTDVET